MTVATEFQTMALHWLLSIAFLSVGTEFPEMALRLILLTAMAIGLLSVAFRLFLPTMTIENEFLPTELRSLLSKEAFLGMEMHSILSMEIELLSVP